MRMTMGSLPFLRALRPAPFWTGQRLATAGGLGLLGAAAGYGLYRLACARTHADGTCEAIYKIPKTFEKQEGKSIVDEASEDSFPASDPPSWTPNRSGAPRK